MTNYNEKLEEILEDLGDYHEHLYDNIWLAGNGEYTKEKAKQALTALIKELVAEAKPGYDAVKNSGRDEAINEFEQNLLKELEEV